MCVYTTQQSLGSREVLIDQQQNHPPPFSSSSSSPSTSPTSSSSNFSSTSSLPVRRRGERRPVDGGGYCCCCHDRVRRRINNECFKRTDLGKSFHASTQPPVYRCKQALGQRSLPFPFPHTPPSPLSCISCPSTPLPLRMTQPSDP